MGPANTHNMAVLRLHSHTLHATLGGALRTVFDLLLPNLTRTGTGQDQKKDAGGAVDSMLTGL